MTSRGIVEATMHPVEGSLRTWLLGLRNIVFRSFSKPDPS